MSLVSPISLPRLDRIDAVELLQRCVEVEFAIDPLKKTSKSPQYRWFRCDRSLAI
jgi:hypothetical protein